MASESSEMSSSLVGAATRGRSGFFLAAHGVLLLIVLVGFAPSFYLRATFPHVHQLPVFLHIHGAVLTGWFVLTVVQGWLIRSQRFQLLIYDFVTRRRPHPVSLIGMVGILASIAGAVFLGVTGIGYHWING